MAEELRDVRGRLPESSDKSDYDLSLHAGLEAKLDRYKNKYRFYFTISKGSYYNIKLIILLFSY